MKSKIILKLTSNLLLLALILPAWSNSQELCFPDTKESQKLLVEIKYGQQAFDKLKICQEQYSTSTTINNNNETIIKGLQQDKVIITEVSENFKKQYIDTSNKLTDCIEAKPSRLTWFSYGVGSTLLGSLIITYLITK